MRLWFFGIVSVSELVPAALDEVEYNTFEGSLLVMVTCITAGAGPFSVMFTVF